MHQRCACKGKASVLLAGVRGLEVLVERSHEFWVGAIEGQAALFVDVVCAGSGGGSDVLLLAMGATLVVYLRRGRIAAGEGVQCSERRGWELDSWLEWIVWRRSR